jgi:outer membrane protein OmpA-like peptidoglycan-associated protein
MIMPMRFLPPALAAAVIGMSLAAHADDLTSQDIVNALDPKTAKPSVTRSWNSNKRGITIEGGAKQEGPPSVNLYVNFAYDSAELLTDSQITLDNLAKALKDERLAGSSFLVAGHTDAKGPDDYNLDLSRRRADSVVQYLVTKHGIAASRLTEKGFGETQLLDPDHPEDGINRRVQIVNLTAGS